MLVTFLVAVTKIPDKSKEGRVDHSCQLKAIVQHHPNHSGRSKRQLVTLYPVGSRGGGEGGEREREIGAQLASSLFPLDSVLDPSPWDGTAIFRVGLPYSVKSLWKCLQSTPEVCLLGDSRSHQADSQD